MQSITPELLQNITQRIARELDPEEIILFGSYAWGNPDPESDLDLCVIVQDGIPGYNRIQWGTRALNCIEDLRVDADIFVTTRSGINTFSAVPASLQRKIVEQGKPLYGSRKSVASKSMAEKSSA